MSAWDQYITNMTACGLQVSGIYGMEGGAWAQSENMKGSQTEIASIVSGLNGQNFSNGVTVNGVKYQVINYGPDTVTMKARGAPDETKNYLMHAAKAKTCLVMGGICGAGERNATVHVENIRDYLAKSGY